MNVIFCSQGSALNIFNGIIPEMEQLIELENIGLFVADQFYYDRFNKKNNNLKTRNIIYLKEWEVVKEAQRTRLDLEKIALFEKKYGNPYLWTALMADRRVFLGTQAKYRQDYGPRCTHEMMLGLIQTYVPKIENLLEQTKPDAIVAFNMVTLGEYLIYLIAKQKKITYRQLKNAKIENLVTLFKDPLKLSAEIKQAENQTVDRANVKKARNYLALAQKKQSTYEGHVMVKARNILQAYNWSTIIHLIKAVGFELEREKYQNDWHSGGLGEAINYGLGKPAKAVWHHTVLGGSYIPTHKLKKIDYVFFPLHTEPEISLSIYGRWYQNQIELIRNIAQSVPVTWKVVVKDHPRSLGQRSLRYYEKLLEIPNVRLVSPYESSYAIIQQAKAIITISSWVGFEGVVSKKPVITCGECAYNALPDSMVKKIDSIKEVAQAMQHLIADYEYNEEALLSHISTVFGMSHPIDLYSGVLNKKNRHVFKHEDGQQNDVFKGLAKYICKSIKE